MSAGHDRFRFCLYAGGMSKRDQSTLYMTAEQAAATLGISLKSLYAYVSRKNIRSRTEGSRHRYYWAEDIHRLARGERIIGPDSVMVPSSRITQLGEAGPVYRGKAAIDLAECATLEEVAALLWNGAPAAAFTGEATLMGDAFAQARDAVAELNIISKAICLFPLIEERHPRSFDLSPEGYAVNGANILRWFAALMIGADRPTTQPLHEMVTGVSADTHRFSDLVRRALVLAADHELAPATYVVRAAANTGVTAWQAVTAGLASSQGRRLTGGRAFLVRRLLAEIVTSSDPRTLILHRYRDDEALPGFGDGAYPESDPRAEAIIHQLRTQHSDMMPVQRFLKAVEAAKDIYGRHPDFIVTAALIEYELGLDRFDGSLMALGRIAGWIAHAAEQQASGEMIRIRTVYAGQKEVSSEREVSHASVHMEDLAGDVAPFVGAQIEDK